MAIPQMVQSPRIIKKNDEKLSVAELSKFMKKHGVGEKELAEILGVTLQAVMLWLKGKREISITVSRLVRLFDKHPKLIGEF